MPISREDNKETEEQYTHGPLLRSLLDGTFPDRIKQHPYYDAIRNKSTESKYKRFNPYEKIAEMKKERNLEKSSGNERYPLDQVQDTLAKLTLSSNPSRSKVFPGKENVSNLISSDHLGKKFVYNNSPIGQECLLNDDFTKMNLEG